MFIKTILGTVARIFRSAPVIESKTITLLRWAGEKDESDSYDKVIVELTDTRARRLLIERLTLRRVDQVYKTMYHTYINIILEKIQKPFDRRRKGQRRIRDRPALWCGW